MSIWKRLLGEDDGQDIYEYALLMAFIATVLAGFVLTWMTYVDVIWGAKTNELSQAASVATS
jgi:Flp pilus assembly pilin Flp